MIQEITTFKETERRFSGLPWFNQVKENTITIGGVGGLGSWLALLLSRTGCPINIYDMDTVEDTNIAGQFYKNQQIGLKKTEAVLQNILELVELPTIRCFEKFQDNSLVTNVCFSAFDSIEARLAMLQSWVELEDKDKLFLDGRLGADFYRIKVVTSLEEALQYNLSESGKNYEELPCNFKQTSHIAVHCAATMVSMYLSWVQGIGISEMYYNANNQKLTKCIKIKS